MADAGGLRFLYAARYRGTLLSAFLHPLGELLVKVSRGWREWKGRIYKVTHEASL